MLRAMSTLAVKVMRWKVGPTHVYLELTVSKPTDEETFSVRSVTYPALRMDYAHQG